ncbi:MAG: ABC transporter ATP-binding protein [Deltaproteobacteria bacterium]|nr:ABC transporter ATP-binding protein [Deltaproteobacteria bacterium]
MLKVSEIEVRYSGVPVIHNVSLEVREGELVSIVGANGAGKSTLLKTIAGALHPSRGSVQFENQDISRLSTAGIVQRGITYVPEARLIFGPLTVQENLEIGAYILNDEEEMKKNLEEVYHLFPRLAERRLQLGGTLSGGEQQMLAIGRGLMSNPKLLMLDEPSLGLMPKLVDEMLEAVAKLKGTGKTILLVEQKVREALDLSDRGYVLQTGRTIHQGTGKELLNAEIIKKAFLGL